MVIFQTHTRHFDYPGIIMSCVGRTKSQLENISVTVKQNVFPYAE